MCSAARAASGLTLKIGAGRQSRPRRSCHAHVANLACLLHCCPAAGAGARSRQPVRADAVRHGRATRRLRGGHGVDAGRAGAHAGRGGGAGGAVCGIDRGFHGAQAVGRGLPAVPCLGRLACASGIGQQRRCSARRAAALVAADGARRRDESDQPQGGAVLPGAAAAVRAAGAWTGGAANGLVRRAVHRRRGVGVWCRGAGG